MSTLFPMRILTPERTFFTGNVQSITLESIDGRLGVMAGHVPMLSALHAGQMRICTDEEELIAFHSEGFLDVTDDEVLVFCQACEWPDEIDEGRARRAADRASSRITLAHSPEVLMHSRIALSRAVARLRTKHLSG